MSESDARTTAVKAIKVLATITMTAAWVGSTVEGQAMVTGWVLFVAQAIGLGLAVNARKMLHGAAVIGWMVAATLIVQCNPAINGEVWIKVLVGLLMSWMLLFTWSQSAQNQDSSADEERLRSSQP